MDSNFSVKITADITELQARLNTLESTVDKFKVSMDKAAGATKTLEQNANRGRMVAFAFGQVIRDAGFFANSTSLGILAISNNVPILIDQLSLAIPALSGVAGTLSLLGSLLTAGLTIWAYSSEAVKKNKQSIDEWRQSLDDATEIQLKGQQAALEEVTSLDILYRAATNVANSTKTRMQAAKQLQDLYPSIFANMSQESILLGKAKSGYDSLRISIIETAMAEAAKDKIVQNASRILDNNVRIREAQIQKSKLAAQLLAEETKAQDEFNRAQSSMARSAGKEGIDPLLTYKRISGNVLDIKEQISEQDQIIRNAQGDTNILTQRNADLTKQIDLNTKSYVQSLVKAESSNAKIVRDSIDASKLYAKGTPGASPFLETPALKDQVKGFDIVGTKVNEMTKLIAQSIPTVGDLTMSLVNQVSTGFADIITSFSEGLGQLISGDMSFAEFGRSIISSIGKFLSQMGKQMISFGAATIAYGVALKAIKSGNPAAMITGGGALIAAGAALSIIGSAISSLAGGKGGDSGGRSSVSVAGDFGSVRPFAAGGIVSGPTLGLMGEYPGARRNPEVVAPLDRLKSIIGASAPAQDTGNLVARISGNDLVILMDRAKKNRSNYF